MGSDSEREWSSSESKALQMCVICEEDDDSVGDLQSCDTCERWFCTSDRCATEMLGRSFDKRLRCGDIECSACKAERKAERKAKDKKVKKLATSAATAKTALDLPTKRKQ
jgi:hypothetical protein